MTRMQIRVGFEIEYQCRDATPMILALSIHYSRASDLLRPDHLVTSPAVPVTAYRDLFGNWCSRLVALLPHGWRGRLGNLTSGRSAHWEVPWSAPWPAVGWAG